MVHAVRVGLFCLIILLIRLQHGELNKSASSGDFSAIDVSRLERLFPDANSISEGGPATAKLGAARSVLDSNGQPIGYLLQTSPDSDSLVGFSGPTNVLIAFAPDDRIVGIDVVSSRDTREHVAQVLESEPFMNAFSGLTGEKLLTCQSWTESRARR